MRPAMRGINESHYLSDEQSVFSASDVEGGGGSMSGGGGNVYEVEHLATFQLSEELSLPADGMRRLLHMEKNGFGIWSQKMRIRLESRYIVILDFENGDEMERFPLHLIRDPTAFTNPNPGELYNNIFAFIVHPVEMHIFQCFNISATDLVEDVKMALSGRLPPHRQRHGSQNSLPPPPVNPPPEPPGFHGHEDGRDDASSVGSEGRYEREVAILNRCFDDIERFIARLQYAAAAYRELQRRRKSKKSKKKDHGEGLLSMRARPPHEREFVYILQKFKLSFNLLARLKSHIHDPNAPELVHFLFTPLALIVDASRDAHTAGLAIRVVSPLLYREAIELLNNCLTSKETELWHSLGDAWLLTRDQWNGYVEPYQPIFMDGWSPTIPESNLSESVAKEAQIRAQELQRAKQEAANAQRIGSREPSVSPVEMVNDDFATGQRAFRDSVLSKGGRLVVVTHPRTANNQKELTVVRGEYLEVLDDTKKWWKARNWKSQVAHVPHTIVSELSQDSSASYHNENGRSGAWTPPSSSMDSDDDGYPSGRGHKGKNLPPPPPPPAPPKENDLAANGHTDYVPLKSSPIPRAPIKRATLTEEMVQQELKDVLAVYSEKRHLGINKTPEVYVNQHSSPSEIKEWLNAKGFSERTIKQLAGMDGNQLFGLKRKQLEDVCGRAEGSRLDSQITISRNVSGFKTARSSQLQEILAKVRARAERNGDDADDDGLPPRPVVYNNNQPKTRSKSPEQEKIAKPKENNYRDRNNAPKNNNNNVAKSRPVIPRPPPDPVVSKSKYISHDSDSDSEDSMDGKGTLGKMLKQKRGEIFRK